MGKSLAELRQQPDRPERTLARRTYRVCLAQNLLGELQALTNELIQITSGRRETSDDGERRAPGRMGSLEIAREQEVRARMIELDGLIEDESGDLTLEAIDEGDWDLWVAAHPARGEKDDEAGAMRDIEVAGGYCNANDLMDSLERFVIEWDGDPLGDGDWKFISAHIARGDRKGIAKQIVIMQENAVDLPFLQRAWRAGLTSERD